jgi:hypothetical protein
MLPNVCSAPIRGIQAGDKSYVRAHSHIPYKLVTGNLPTSFPIPLKIIHSFYSHFHRFDSLSTVCDIPEALLPLSGDWGGNTFA